MPQLDLSSFESIKKTKEDYLKWYNGFLIVRLPLWIKLITGCWFWPWAIKTWKCFNWDREISRLEVMFKPAIEEKNLSDQFAAALQKQNAGPALLRALAANLNLGNPIDRLKVQNILIFKLTNNQFRVCSIDVPNGFLIPRFDYDVGKETALILDPKYNGHITIKPEDNNIYVNNELTYFIHGKAVVDVLTTVGLIQPAQPAQPQQQPAQPQQQPAPQPPLMGLQYT